MSEEYPQATEGTRIARKIREEHQKQRASSFAAPAGSPPVGRRWWSGIWMTDELLMAVAIEEGWKPETAFAARDAAAWLNAKGKTVVQAENDKVSGATQDHEQI